MSLIAENVGLYYRKNNWIFNNVNFELHRGEIVGISGYSGCGKSSFAKILANDQKPVCGKVLVDGRPAPANHYQPVQMIHQHPEKTLNPKWRMWRSLNEGFVPDPKLIERFGIQDQWYNRFPVEISGGEMQRFCIVRALGNDTKYLIADEMTTMLDSVTQAKIWKEMVAIVRERNLGLIVISHETELLAMLCDRILSVHEMQNAL